MQQPSRVLTVVAKRYNGHELWTALGVLHEQGFGFEVVSQNTRIKDEVTGQPNIIERVVWDVEIEEVDSFDGVLVVSGNMADTEAYWDDTHVLKLLDKFHEQDKVIGAICCSVPTVRNVARGKRVSFYPLVRSRERLESAGAILQDVACTADGKLLTAEHQMATQMWAGGICNVLKGEEAGIELTSTGFRPQGRERKPIPELEWVKKKQGKPYDERFA